jgi:hypothetical protein
MEKKICAYIFTITFILLSSRVHGSPTELQRSPSVEPVIEVDIEDAKAPGHAGFNFVLPHQPETAAKNLPTISASKRVPANIVAKSEATSSTSMTGPFIFLIALPIGLWIIVSRKFSNLSSDKNVDYYPKTQQFKPYQTDCQETAEDDDDIDYPKAS